MHKIYVNISVMYVMMSAGIRGIFISVKICVRLHDAGKEIYNKEAFCKGVFKA